MYFKDTVNSRVPLQITPFEDKRHCTINFPIFLELSAKKTKAPKLLSSLWGGRVAPRLCVLLDEQANTELSSQLRQQCASLVRVFANETKHLDFICKGAESYTLYMCLLTLTMFNKSSLVLNTENVLNKTYQSANIKPHNQPFLIEEQQTC